MAANGIKRSASCEIPHPALWFNEPKGCNIKSHEGPLGPVWVVQPGLCYSWQMQRARLDACVDSCGALFYRVVTLRCGERHGWARRARFTVISMTKNAEEACVQTPGEQRQR